MTSGWSTENFWKKEKLVRGSWYDEPKIFGPWFSISFPKFVYLDCFLRITISKRLCYRTCMLNYTMIFQYVILERLFYILGLNLVSYIFSIIRTSDLIWYLCKNQEKRRSIKIVKTKILKKLSIRKPPKVDLHYPEKFTDISRILMKISKCSIFAPLKAQKTHFTKFARRDLNPFYRPRIRIGLILCKCMT